MRMMLETEALVRHDGYKFSCIVVIGETVLFLGGVFENRQISQLTPLGLIRIGTLPFKLGRGTCLAMGSQIFLGFGLDNRKSCWSR